jgi:hypothetical protein
LKTVTLGYTIPENLLSRLDIKKLRFYVTAQNPYLYKRCWSVDPESPGLSVPSVKTFMGGLSLSF